MVALEKPSDEERGLDLVQLGEQAYDEQLDLLADLGDEVLASRLCEAASFGDLSQVDAMLRAGTTSKETQHATR